MYIGMLWFDNAPGKPVAAKITGAAEYYEKKYGRVPNLCYVSKNTETPEVEGVEVKSSPSILPNHFWLGVEEVQHVTESN